MPAGDPLSVQVGADLGRVDAIRAGIPHAIQHELLAVCEAGFDGE
jgi:hypothetical protein